jgi:RsmE family RNA methyltransferase
VGVTKPGALDEIIQVCVEAGVAELILCKADKTTSRQEIKLEKVMRQVGEICRITKSPWSMRVVCAESFLSAFEKVHGQYNVNKVLICDERPAHTLERVSENTTHLLEESRAFAAGDLLFAVGPEASFSSVEYEFFLKEERAGRAKFVSLGPRILRTPAAVAAAAYLLSACVESKPL